MSQALTTTVENLKLRLPHEVPMSYVSFLRDLTDMGEKAMKHKKDLPEDAADVMVRGMLGCVAAKHRESPAMDETELYSLLYSVLMVGVGLSINEEIR